MINNASSNQSLEKKMSNYDNNCFLMTIISKIVQEILAIVCHILHS